MSPQLHGVIYYAFVPPDWRGPEDGAEWEPIRVDETFFNAKTGHMDAYTQEHIDNVARFLDDLARLYHEANVRGDHVVRDGERVIDLHRGRPCDCAERAAIAASRARTGERTMAVRVKVVP